MRTRALRAGLATARIVAALVVLFVVGLEIAVSLGDYDLALLDDRPDPSLTIEDRGGELLAERVNADGMRHRWVSIDDVSPAVVQATIAVEDARFWDHQGVDWRGAARAARDSLWAGRVVSGASTLTMQLARLLEPHPRKSVVGKMVEVVAALRMERAVSKRVILEQYLNRAPYGAGTIGIEAASWRYFSKPSKALTTSEATLLAGLPQSPSRYNPLLRYQRAVKRRATVLRRMAEEGMLDAASLEALWRQPPPMVAQHNPARATHLIDRLAARGDQGLTRATLDGQLQQTLEAVVADRAADLRRAGAPHAAVVVLDNATCGVLAMVGSPDYWAPGSGAVNGAMARRQPGSTLKPFVYALAFEDGDHAGTVIPDVPTRYGAPGGVLYSPRNYDRSYSGPVAMGEALVRSLNVPAMVAAERVGLTRLYQHLRSLGFESLDKSPEHYGLGLSLGNGEVRLLEVAQAYATLARAGRGCRARFTSSDPERAALVIAPTAAARITYVLSDDKARSRAFGLDGALLASVPVAVKTGTSANWRDSWAVGFTGDHTVAVWVGDFANTSTQQLTGATGAGPVFRQVLEAVVERFGPPRPIVDPTIEARLGHAEVCALSGMPASDHCPHRRHVRTGGATRADHACDWHRPVRLERRSKLLAGPACGGQDVVTRVETYLPREYAEWQALTGQPAPPTRYAPRCPGDGSVADALRVTWPRGADVFVVDPVNPPERQSLLLRAAVEPRVAKATWWVDGAAVGTVEWPYTMVWPLSKGRHEVQLVAGMRRSPPVRFEVR